jgi:chaperonin GroES
MSRGDALASGAVRAQFNPASGVTEEEWHKIFGEAEKKLQGMSELDRQKFVEEETERLKLIEQEKNKPVVQVKIRAVQDRILVRRVESETVTTGGLYLADESKEKPAEGIVVAIGPGKRIDGQFVQTDIQVGERVVFGKFSGAEVKVGLDVLVVLREEDIFLVKETNLNQTKKTKGK